MCFHLGTCPWVKRSWQRWIVQGHHSSQKFGRRTCKIIAQKPSWQKSDYYKSLFKVFSYPGQCKDLSQISLLPGCVGRTLDASTVEMLHIKSHWPQALLCLMFWFWCPASDYFLIIRDNLFLRFKFNLIFYSSFICDLTILKSSITKYTLF